MNPIQVSKHLSLYSEAKAGLVFGQVLEKNTVQQEVILGKMF